MEEVNENKIHNVNLNDTIIKIKEQLCELENKKS